MPLAPQMDFNYKGPMYWMLRNTNLFAPDPKGHVDILVCGRTIVAVGESLPELPDRLGPQSEVDLEGKRVVPGLIDCHAHITGGGGEAGPATRVPPLTIRTLVDAGVTTVVGVLGTDGSTRTVRDLVATTYGLCDQGITAWCYTGSYEVPPLTLTGRVRDDLVFLAPVVGVGEVALSDHRSSQPTVDEIARIAADCHVSGLLTGKAGLLHLHMGDGRRGLEFVRTLLDTTEIPARVFHPTHCNRNPRLWAEALDIVNRGVTIDVTAYEEECPGELTAAQALVEYWEKGAPPGRITVSSDGGGCIPTFDSDGRMVRMDVGQPQALIGTIRVLLEQGVPLERILPPFTSNVANLFRWPSKGRVEPGADADLLVLDEHGAVSDVMALGRWMVREVTTK